MTDAPGSRLMGVVANHGPITARDAVKMAHLVELCDQRGIPLLFLQNSPPDTGRAPCRRGVKTVQL